MVAVDLLGSPADRRPAFPAHRVSFFFSARGDHAAFLRDVGEGGLGVETWAWRDGSPRRQVLSTRGETLHSQPLPLDDGRVLVLRAGPGAHDLVLLAPGRPEAEVGRIESRGLHLLPSPAAGTLAVASGLREDGSTALWLIKAASPHIQAVPVRGMPGGIWRGGHWLDGHGQVLGFTGGEAGGAGIFTVNLATGVVGRADFAADCALLLTEPGAGRFLVAYAADGKPSFGWGRWHRGDWELDFPAFPVALDGAIAPLAVDPAGNAIAFRAENGLRSEVAICVPGERSLRRLPSPPGSVFPAARWTAGGLHLVGSRPDRPANVMTIPSGADRWLACPDPAPAGGWAAAHAEALAGPAGPVEAVVYGGPGWRDAKLLLVALHGGPHSAWKLCFDPLFQDLAAAGVAIVAPNQRGSAGYGAAYRDAIRGAWGGPDLADITHIAAALTAYRQPRGLPRLKLFGVSYGAFLALLAAAARPDLWSHCAALSPFCSARSLYASGSDSVRSFLHRVDALGVIDDRLGPRDLERLAGRITARLFIAHGTGDEKIPASEPRQVVAALERAGRRRGTDFVSRETRGGHDLVHSAAGTGLRRDLAGFFSQPEAR